MQQPKPSHPGFSDQLIAEGERTRVVRHRLPDGSCVIRKHVFGPDALARLHHEQSILERVASVPGVARLASGPSPANTLTLQDDGGITLAQRLTQGPLSVGEVLAISQQLAETLIGLHHHGVLHKDINPANILLAQPGQRTVLIDFNIASTFAEERPAFTHAKHIAGTLAYMAPEQTGRTGRAVDQRSDLYALGATLYELATRRPPFEGDDLLTTIHQHLTATPPAPLSLRAELPQGWSDIVMRLLEKEPDRRYQSAEGLLHDLTRVATLHTAQQDTAFALGEFDFPRKITPPSRLIGRNAEIAVLRNCFNETLTGKAQCVLVAGAPGVGKSVLIDELKPWVTAQRGWFVAGKFDQYHPASDGGALTHALRQLGRLLLAEPEDQLIDMRARLLAHLGSNASLMAALPEFSRIMGVPPETSVGDPVQAAHRMRQGTLDLLRAMASASRPVVLALDDLQWASVSAMSVIDAIQSEAHLTGLMLVGAYRPQEIDATHALTALLARWAQRADAPVQLPLKNLPPSSVSELLQEMLRLPRADAARLAQAVGMRTAGNPYDTVELINALRSAGALTVTGQGWQWDAQAIRHFVGQGEVIDLLAARIERLPKFTRALLEMLACLGSDVKIRTLCVASGLASTAVEDQLRPAFEDGLIQRDAHVGPHIDAHTNAHTDALSATDTTPTAHLRFRHDRVQQATYSRMEPSYLCMLQLTLARRLAAQPETARLAAQQYMPALALVQEPAERSAVVRLFSQMALRARVVNYPVAERYFNAALGLLDSAPPVATELPLWVDLLTGRHAALYALGRHAEADEAYARLVARGPAPTLLVTATQVQMQSLVSRVRTRDALALGMGLLQQLGLPRPDDLMPDIQSGMATLLAWAQSLSDATPIDTPEIQDPAVQSLAKLVRSTQVPAYFCDPIAHTWLVLQGLHIWQAHGSSAGLVAGLASTGLLLSRNITHARPAYEATRYLLRLGEARGYEPELSWARHFFTVTNAPWFEPIDDCLPHSLRAREGLLQGGDLQGAAFTFYQAAIFLLDCGQTLEGYAAEIDAGAAFEQRSGSTILERAWVACRQFLHAMRGQTAAPGSFSEGDLDEAAIPFPTKYPNLANANYHSYRALSAAIYDDAPALIQHAQAAFWHKSSIEAFYAQTHIYLVQGLAQAEQARATAGSPTDPADTTTQAAHTQHLQQLDACLAWMTERARHAPSNFLQLQLLLQAERAWACGEHWAAATLYNEALMAAPPRGRPWHQAYITERAGLYHLRCGLASTGRMLLTEARSLYAAWGATGKARLMAHTHGFLRSRTRGTRASTQSPRRSTILTSETVDMVGILRASQLLSSETRLEQLTARVSQLLGEMTGAAKVTLAVLGEDHVWSVAPTERTDGAAPLTVAQAGQQGLLPLSAFRYVERLQESLLVPDAKRDDRFARDPYVAPLTHCSLLLAPIVHKNALRAVLILENSLSHGAFSDDRIDVVALIAGQLAVSIENAQVYASLERKVAQRTEALADANQRLEQLSITDALTGLNNRRRFNEVIELECKRGERSRAPIGLLMIDIDQFKKYNDHYGHQTGDTCLRRVAQALQLGLHRATDFVARYGGEEFVVVLPATPLEGTQLVAERLRELVAAALEPHVASDHGIVTISLGYTAFIPNTHTPWAQQLEAADQALYRAKESGRNQAVAAPGEASLTSSPSSPLFPLFSLFSLSLWERAGGEAGLSSRMRRACAAVWACKPRRALQVRARSLAQTTRRSHQTPMARIQVLRANADVDSAPPNPTPPPPPQHRAPP